MADRQILAEGLCKGMKKIDTVGDIISCVVILVMSAGSVFLTIVALSQPTGESPTGWIFLANWFCLLTIVSIFLLLLHIDHLMLIHGGHETISIEDGTLVSRRTGRIFRRRVAIPLAAVRKIEIDSGHSGSQLPDYPSSLRVYFGKRRSQSRRIGFCIPTSELKQFQHRLLAEKYKHLQNYSEKSN
ncbi:MAG: hypothetical protein J5641_03085 [Bacteroidales bacterium]|nr:hypothetical protein [Bacteroidales bacterium]